MGNARIQRGTVTATATALAAAGLTALLISRSTPEQGAANANSEAAQPLRSDDALLAESDEVATGFRRAQQDTVAIFSTMILAGLCCAALMGWVTAGPDPSSSSMFSAWKSAASGWLAPADSLVIALSLLAVIATINIAVSVPMNVRLMQDQIAVTFWRESLGKVCWLLAVTAVAIGTLTWTFEWNSDSFRTVVGRSLAVNVVAIACALLAATISVGNASAAKRHRTLSQIADRKRQLEDRLVDTFGINPNSVHRPDFTRPRVRSHAFRILAVSITVSALVTLAALAFGITTDVKLHFPLLFCAVMAVAAVTTSGTWFFAYRSWSEYHKHARWGPTAAPWRFPVGIIILPILVITVIDFDRSVALALLGASVGTAALFLLPSVFLSLSRPDRAAKSSLLQWPGELVWEATGRTLESRINELESRREDLIAKLQSHS